MRYLSLREILELHDKIIEISGGTSGIRDMRALESAINQPRKHLIGPTFIRIF